MNKQEDFSIVTRRYLARFYVILDDMIRNMTGAKLTKSISYNFIVQMIPHHRAAIEMSHNLLQDTTLVPLQNIAINIINEQTKSIENMMRVMNHCGMLENTEQDKSLYLEQYHQITQTMFTDMKTACTTNNINADFMREMIPHHEGAIRLSENALRFPICPELKPILQAIITSQQEGVREMEYLLQCL